MIISIISSWSCVINSPYRELSFVIKKSVIISIISSWSCVINSTNRELSFVIKKSVLILIISSWRCVINLTNRELSFVIEVGDNFNNQFVERCYQFNEPRIIDFLIMNDNSRFVELITPLHELIIEIITDFNNERQFSVR